MADPLDTVLRIRRVTVDDAKRDLAALLRAEEAAQTKAEATEALIAQEAAAATDLRAGDDAVESYAAWLPVGRANAAAARAAHEDACAAVSQARAALTVARASAESAQQLLDKRAEHRRAEMARKDQAVLDEIASRSRNAGFD
jgi:flagellar export protein FliJ